MTKEKWIEHMTEDGTRRPSQGGDRAAWIDKYREHIKASCPVCKDRARTRRRNMMARIKTAQLASLGLHRVVGQETGHIYYE